MSQSREDRHCRVVEEGVARASSPCFHRLEAGATRVGRPSSTGRYERVDERGRFVEVVAEGDWKTIIYGAMKAGAVMGNHYHKITRIYFYLIKGVADIDIERIGDGARRSTTLVSGQGIYLETNEAHAVRFREPSQFIMAKSRPFDPDAPDCYEHEVAPDAKVDNM